MATKKPGKPDDRLQSIYRLRYWIYLILLAGILLIWLLGAPAPREISWSQFERELIYSGDIEKLIVVNEERVEVYIKEDSLNNVSFNNLPKQKFSGKFYSGPHYFFNIGSVDAFHDDLETAQANLPPDKHIEVTYSKETNWWITLISWLLPLSIIILFWQFILRRGGLGSGGQGSIYNFNKSRARVTEKGEKGRVTFNDIAGLEEAKEEILELVKFLKSPQRYNQLGAKIPKGILLVGPPGTGKTLLAKAVAGEADVPFFSLTGSEFIEMYVGVGAARMRDLFEKAKAKAPSIIFIDEIDTIGRARSGVKAFQANEERDSTLNQLLAELDGFDTSTGVIVLAATNRGDILDPALLRPGRFDRHIHLELPNLHERKAIFAVHMKQLKLATDVNVEILAAQTPGFSGADIANICNEAALIAARNEKDAVYKKDFMDAIDRIIGGLEKRTKIISPEEKRRIAFHEAGHVTTSWFLKNAYPVLKVSVIPRGKSLGAAWYLPDENQIFTQPKFMDALCTALGGRAAEELIFNEVSSNAVDDLEKVTKQAYAMVVNYGMGNTLRNMSFFDSTGQAEFAFQKPYSEKTAEKIDEEVQRIIDEAYTRTSAILSKHKQELTILAETLIEKEVVERAEIEQLLGKRIFD
ncbi:MAG: ATP-dependent metallopeptidase FtsH/Yme1/Tma family protein [Bacteroidetes bacterium]|nr:ATP-dependent metallopeptidase FtsH/Yme1/Tma family protein [Bacteroidota bacterium]